METINIEKRFRIDNPPLLLVANQSLIWKVDTTLFSSLY